MVTLRWDSVTAFMYVSFQRALNIILVHPTQSLSFVSEEENCLSALAAFMRLKNDHTDQSEKAILLDDSVGNTS